MFSSAPDVQARFYHEEAFGSNKSHFLPEVDFLDIAPRREEVKTARGAPTMLQLTLQPAYALTIHKVQSLTIRDIVHGCLEGMFAHGQIYVLISRVVDPANFHAVVCRPKICYLQWRRRGRKQDLMLTNVLQKLSR